MAFYTSDRMRRTGLDEVLDYLYSAPDHDLPEGLGPEQLRKYRVEHYELRRTEHRHTPRGAVKPNPALLLHVWARYGEVHRREEYELLRRVSHWTPEDVERERQLKRELTRRFSSSGMHLPRRVANRPRFRRKTVASWWVMR